MSDHPRSIQVGIETTDTKVFASALDWPGWSRAGRTEAAALEALAAVRARYAAVVHLATIAGPGDGPLEVVERLPGNATTSFGAPAIVFAADREPADEQEAARLASLVAAAFTTLDTVVAAAPAELRKGPRGGGRDRDGVVEHVRGAHGGYLRPTVGREPVGTGDAERRATMLAVIGRPSDGTPPEGAKWPQRYAARRIAWHALDHAWEIEDRTPE